MKAIILGIAAMIVVAYGASVWLGSMQQSAKDRYSVSTSVRL
jgi:hypothetical protein